MVRDLVVPRVVVSKAGWWYPPVDRPQVGALRDGLVGGASAAVEGVGPDLVGQLGVGVRKEGFVCCV